MSSLLMTGLLTEEQKTQFHTEGYLIVRELFSREEVAEILDTFMTMHTSGPIPGCFELPRDHREADPLRAYPRMLYPHRFNEVVKRYMVHPKVMGIMADLMDEEPLAAQSMFYFKPPGSRGQALHQDNYYLKVEPGTCVAAWTAIDPADEENGGLVVVPQTNHLPIECPHQADADVSFTIDEVTLPEGKSPVPANMGAGDVLFFNGSMIHGSYPNRSRDRFRRSFICHYVGASTTRIGRDDLYNHLGEVVYKPKNEDAGPCGTPFAALEPH